MALSKNKKEDKESFGFMITDKMVSVFRAELGPDGIHGFNKFLTKKEAIRLHGDEKTAYYYDKPDCTKYYDRNIRGTHYDNFHNQAAFDVDRVVPLNFWSKLRDKLDQVICKEQEAKKQRQQEESIDLSATEYSGTSTE